MGEQSSSTQGLPSLVTSNARITRRNTQVTLVVGFIFIVCALALTLLVRDPATSIAAGGIAALGTVVTGYIGGGILRNAEGSASEIAAFFSHPIEIERLLTAERIADGHELSEKSAAKTLIIQALTRVPTVSAPGSSGEKS